MQLSQHFSLEEFTLSRTADRRHIDNAPDSEIIERLTILSESILEPIRNHFGPIHINSGYRCKELNSAIGGSKTSQHVFGEASDIVSRSYSPYIINCWTRDNIDIYDQNIFEGRWTHISFSTRRGNRKMDLTADFSKKPVKYSKGIIGL